MMDLQSSLQLHKLEKLITDDQKLVFTLTSYIIILAIYVNLNVFQSWALGVAASVIFFLINGIFLGNAFFQKEAPFFRLMFGILLLIILLGFAGWLAIIIYNLDFLIFTCVLLIVATLSSLLNKRMKNQFGT